MVTVVLNGRCSDHDVVMLLHMVTVVLMAVVVIMML
jgi:hypothetical protein